MRVRRILAAALLTATTLGLAACGDDDLDGGGDAAAQGCDGSGDKGSLVLSGQNFDEATLMGAMYECLLEKAGYDVESKPVGTRDLYAGKLANGEIQVVPEYVGGIIDFLNSKKNGADAPPLTTADPFESIEAAKSLLDAEGITLLNPAEAADTNAFFVTQEYAEENSVSKLSDLRGKSVVLAAHPDCQGRADCEKGLSEKYGIKITKVLGLGFGTAQTFTSVKDGESQLGQTATTDGSVEQQGMVLLEDDLGIQPSQNLVPAVNSEFLADNGDVAAVLNELMGKLTTVELADLNYKVTVERAKAADVAEDYLTAKGLLD